ncbi:DNA adenine methylase [Oceanidesulfovibrio indonesiensis]|uniref:DNA adenine methylase n=1 Tax=Oceanidesulfovibrio indonesiensis TaxID=54767 RepID=A0A7M3MAU4_9BACT|nr:DNA adenine methylase [Oceanidesulfovibrio indonesiensis]TVM15048.1 DNA adenine methylase [Oceanidesulfovibrio indonesiensis]
MGLTNSPLRYPGGKSSLAPFLADVVRLNGVEGGTYIEPYGGGAGAALSLLFGGLVRQIVINDFDHVIAAFWNSLLYNTDRFLNKIATVALDIDEWNRQKEILTKRIGSHFDLGFAAFYLNRCNRSGILSAGPIGGKFQNGNYTIGARFNREMLIDKVERIASHRDSIIIREDDAIDLLQQFVPTLPGPKFIYLDPPYYEKGQQLYLNAYDHEDHENLAWHLTSARKDELWVLTYDDTPEIRELYRSGMVSNYSLNYFAHHAKKGHELLITPPGLKLPNEVTVNYGLA